MVASTAACGWVRGIALWCYGILGRSSKPDISSKSSTSATSANTMLWGASFELYDNAPGNPYFFFIVSPEKNPKTPKIRSRRPKPKTHATFCSDMAIVEMSTTVR